MHHVAMILMTVTVVVLLVGITVTLWGGTSFETWEPGLVNNADRGARLPAHDLRPPVRTSVLRYLRGVAIAVVGGFWAGAS